MFRQWRHRRILSRHSIPDPLWSGALREAPVLGRHDASALAHLRELALLFLHEKTFEQAGGLVLTDAMRVRIAVLACELVLELGLDSYDGFRAVIVYPDEFIVRGRAEHDDHGVVHVHDQVLSGEAWDQGPVVLAWSEVDASGRGEGFNVVAHEFAHKLDGLDGVVNGVPPLHRGMDRAGWSATFQREYDGLVVRLDAGEETWLDPYAAENPGEFFAVCTEMFFDVPVELKTEHPALYQLLSQYFRQDPA